MYTLFIDGRAAVDVTGCHVHHIPLAAGIGGLKPFGPEAGEPTSAPELAEAAVRAVARYVVYGSEVDEPGAWCDNLAGQDAMARL